MPFVEIKLWKGRTDEQKKMMIQKVTQVVSECANCPKEHINVVVTEVEKKHWGVGGIPGDELKKDE
ncbi:2-hydroxymuconate tautomerase family protein [Candidatus Woesearchaeota archaeon]|nr:2-hydroxymuconate tautomerase family protein [Candidatus Woesearchaeota archaeon]